ncbi:MAG TPA: UDP-N-acetylmuramoyl-tripeptide--D-alanyl-D-alanine ligase [Phycisphaerae bacterium]|nr:UDP-N-acetylmuramoyl-tripeptide--D-alanyl-D-alanine ligase [Phycisphaerae bacterium]HOJ74653.1 UDP-N-acetylmuramoyl-tripeptide--D-alanyl-D-alanine ligase [Phycisphaerae bacterium]HOM50552.1 UDP-N-acetylmuramoyl-tripeptide--D-alanyl-D-alanine ligase [Phycisphaerae bacterium]HOQ84774.1 UDP-N-acetylmuramoyl-tripeptide--D-alanyl-D-alanine ligase [Phycisphaerae bacterium]HPP26264.1 UDP-N-acetylmuramoyl-tripeptide--D-alanyl-D-alanine ligase [Phycisphaerae bacterium]
MKPLTLEEVVSATEGTCDRSTLPGSVTRVTTDSRDVKPGDLFFAIRGERFDGHQFIGEAFASGAMAAIVRHDFQWASPLMETPEAAKIPPDAILIRVDDTITALGRLGRYCRLRLLEAVTVVAVTGSNGKTTTKSMIAHLLSERWKGRASIKSFNNNIGVPLTLLSVEPSDEFVICEVGTNAPGEIAELARLIEPEVAVITGVSEAHLEGLGSLEKIADEKLSLLKFLRPGGCAILNHDCEAVAAGLKRDRAFNKIKKVTFGRNPDADLRLTAYAPKVSPGADGQLTGSVEFTINDRFQYCLAVPGRHNVSNALAAIAVARRFGMDHEEIAARLATFTLPPMRLETLRVGRLTLINDAYNANPASLAAAVDVLQDMKAPRRRVLIVGDMRELGSESERLHREAAEKIAHAGVQMVVAVGERAKLVAQTVKQASGGAIETHAFGTTETARKRLTSYLRPDDTILIKGSRALGLEKLAEQIRGWAETRGSRGSASRQVAHRDSERSGPATGRLASPSR